MPRPRCSVFIAASLDGFIARPDGGLDWLDAMHVPGEDYGYAEFFATIDTVLIGRKTWNVVRRFDAWPYEGKAVLVATRSSERLPAGVRCSPRGSSTTLPCRSCPASSATASASSTSGSPRPVSAWWSRGAGRAASCSFDMRSSARARSGATSPPRPARAAPPAPAGTTATPRRRPRAPAPSTGTRSAPPAG